MGPRRSALLRHGPVFAACRVAILHFNLTCKRLLEGISFILPNPDDVARLSPPPTCSPKQTAWVHELSFFIVIALTNIGSTNAQDAVLYNETNEYFSVTLYIHAGAPCTSMAYNGPGCLSAAPNDFNTYPLASEFVATVKVHCGSGCGGAQEASAGCAGSSMPFQCGGTGTWYAVTQQDSEIRIAYY